MRIVPGKDPHAPLALLKERTNLEQVGPICSRSVVQRFGAGVKGGQKQFHAKWLFSLISLL